MVHSAMKIYRPERGDQEPVRATTYRHVTEKFFFAARRAQETFDHLQLGLFFVDSRSQN